MILPKAGSFLRSLGDAGGGGAAPVHVRGGGGPVFPEGYPDTVVRLDAAGCVSAVLAPGFLHAEPGPLVGTRLSELQGLASVGVEPGVYAASGPRGPVEARVVRTADGTLAILREDVRPSAEAARDGALHRLAGGLAHDLNNVAAGVLGVAEILEGDDSTREEVVSLAADLLQVGRRTQATARRLQALAGRRVPRLSRVPVSRLFDQLEDALTRVHPRARLSREGEGELVVDVALLEDALVGVFADIREAGATATAHARVLRRAGVPAGLEVVITHDGRPVPREAEDHIFEPYALPKGGGPGSGLALAALAGLAARTGGRLTLHDGHTFHLWVPEEEPDPPAAASALRVGGLGPLSEKPVEARDLREAVVSALAGPTSRRPEG